MPTQMYKNRPGRRCRASRRCFPKQEADPSHILSATIYLRDIANDFAPMNEVWNAWVPDGQAPARACVQAHMARAALRVEISVIAAVID